ncbi:MAG: amino acid adenylation domain-containing protein [Candidatus Omnitrophica bacterium]|nr:amino acid adenylation domain-containing protein [Candidatus Omnitrophota bacterium]MDD5573562.1 amino acid adenylation domain-containing protein [Candidatus Omnitrophota bacterium]
MVKQLRKDKEVRRLEDVLKGSVQARPEAAALRFRGQEMSYGELDLLSGRLACALRGRGLGENSRIGIFVEKSPPAVVAVFGILKAGACYVPLDPMDPAIRLSCIIEDCRLDAVVTSCQKLEGLMEAARRQKNPRFIFTLGTPAPDMLRRSEGCGIQILAVPDNGVSGAAETPAGAPRRSENDTAYILYTSGSTGRPKGVVISHRAALAFVDWAHSCFGVSEADRVASHAPLHFDISIFDVFVTAKAGACLCLVPAGLSAFPSSLAEFLEQERISVWYSVPHPLVQMALHGRLETRDLSALNRILFAGEVFADKYLDQWMRLAPHAVFYNLYGPTETNVCMYHRVERPRPPGAALAIGRPCCGDKVFLLDEKRGSVRAGETGELYVAGPTLMEGYWDDPQKTERAFVRGITPAPQERFFKTGDMAVEDEDGNFVLRGRRDGMIKQRGYRIELGEIESVLYRHPAIGQACLCFVDGGDGGKRIRAVLVAAKNAAFGEEEMRNYCLRHLPSYMVPDDFEFRDSLPRTSTGKVDRQALMEKEGL